MNVYRKGEVFYAPKWVHPQTGVVYPAHSLRTKSRAEAVQKFALEQAGATGAALVHLPQRGAAAPKLSEAFADYYAHKARHVAPATLASYEGHGRAILASLGDWDLGALTGPVGPGALRQWVDLEVERLGGRTHTVVKRLEAVLKPAVRHALAQGRIDREPLWPLCRSDYKAEGRRQLWIGPEQFTRLRAELPDVDTVECLKAPAIVVYPRLWADVIVSTGMHDSDVSRFARKDWDRRLAQWFRVNTKGAAHYGPQWFPCVAYLQAALERADDARRLSPTELWVASAPPPQQWMRQRLKWAAKRAGLAFVPQPIDFRRTCATWLREGWFADDGRWEFDEVAKLLGNSSGMVREVYAQVPLERFVRAVGRVAAASLELVGAARALEGTRKGPRKARVKMLTPAVASTVVNAPKGEG